MTVKPEVTKHRTTSYLPWDAARFLIAALENENKHNTALMVAVGIYTGLRISDILSLKWKDLRGESYVIIEKKRGKRRTLQFHPDLISVRDRYLSRYEHKARPKDESYVFTPQRSHKAQQRPISVTAANKRFSKALERHRIRTANASSHTLRKTFARRIWETHGETESALVLLSEILSHSNIADTRRYLGITDQEIKAAYLAI